ncbi:MAG TPA: isoprenylcysteine carboxylmethyltransferase family protein [Bacteroidota bacterium]|nr:isoprenylcysteine carboxylmethyltransferase family protein [Bacteroidota bacterium]
MDLRQRLFQYRSYTPIPFLIVMVIFAHPIPAGLIAGGLLIVAGEGIRLWGVAIAGSETRTTGPVGGTYLITTGPFAYVRNPLYLGNMMMYVGVGVMSNALFPWLPIVALLWFAFQYSMIVSLEEEYLMKAFPQEFAAYRKATPRFFPTGKKYRAGSHEQPPLDWQSGLRSEKRTLQAIGILVVVLVVFWQLRG